MSLTHSIRRLAVGAAATAHARRSARSASSPRRRPPAHPTPSRPRRSPTSIDLHNDTAEAGTDCPEGGAAVLALRVRAEQRVRVVHLDHASNLGSETLDLQRRGDRPERLARPTTSSSRSPPAMPSPTCVLAGSSRHLLRRGAEPLQPEPHLRGNGADRPSRRRRRRRRDDRRLTTRRRPRRPPTTETPTTEAPITEPPATRAAGRRSRRPRSRRSRSAGVPRVGRRRDDHRLRPP